MSQQKYILKYMYVEEKSIFQHYIYITITVVF
jgi:hypothetical protein